MILVWYGSINGLWPSLSPGMLWVYRALAEALRGAVCVQRPHWSRLPPWW